MAESCRSILCQPTGKRGTQRKLSAHPGSSRGHRPLHAVRALLARISDFPEAAAFAAGLSRHPAAEYDRAAIFHAATGHAFAAPRQTAIVAAAGIDVCSAYPSGDGPVLAVCAVLPDFVCYQYGDLVQTGIRAKAQHAAVFKHRHAGGLL